MASLAKLAGLDVEMALGAGSVHGEGPEGTNLFTVPPCTYVENEAEQRGISRRNNKLAPKTPEMSVCCAREACGARAWCGANCSPSPSTPARQSSFALLQKSPCQIEGGLTELPDICTIYKDMVEVEVDTAVEW